MTTTCTSCGDDDATICLDCAELDPNPAYYSRPLVVALPWVKPPLTGNRTRGNPHARGAEVKKALHEARWAVHTSKVTWAGVPANVTLHFRPADRRRRDADGMFPTLKACQDALVLEGLLPDDGWQHVPAATCRIHPPSGEPAAMWLTLTEVNQ